SFLGRGKRDRDWGSTSFGSGAALAFAVLPACPCAKPFDVHAASAAMVMKEIPIRRHVVIENSSRNGINRSREIILRVYARTELASRCGIATRNRLQGLL